jgi:hypothetical protein
MSAPILARTLSSPSEAAGICLPVHAVQDGEGGAEEAMLPLLQPTVPIHDEKRFAAASTNKNER